MSGEFQVDSVKVSSLPPKDQPKAEAKDKPLIEINFKNETAEQLTQIGLPVVGLGVEIGQRAREAAVENIHESAEKMRNFEKEHPILSKLFLGSGIHKAINWLDSVLK